MKKSLSISLATLASIAAVATPLTTISCGVKLNEKQKEVKKLANEFTTKFEKIYADVIKKNPGAQAGLDQLKTQFNKTNTDEEIAKLDEKQCDLLIASFKSAIDTLDKLAQ
ncbi:hypothetical protein [Metamycoplasma salivarium]|uniref:hypothetical protein n=1 Tax=Metamycoplasma salivarium TaxID=2124 RepID=UPI0003F72173|nr:hypothetical protein [Metamycoplasma salivarium]